MQRKRFLAVFIIAVLAMAGLVSSLASAGSSEDPAQQLAEREQRLVRQQNEVNASARRGPRGPRGPRGFTGPAGPAGSVSRVTVAQGNTVFLSTFPSAGAVGSSSASCPPGTIPLGGGWVGGGILATVGYSAPGTGDWTVIITNNNEFQTTSFHAIVMCGS